ncbi:uncharacterized protein LOC110395090 [Numida meleagris]|uniref:uncharacterized protein LOC110395090 n=1 Tax=Numida meleagris TaxID=8996 RepID=UPI000B3DA2BE|nr:uncharacterized protein LOC110395090 [Numida meleagris]XP_021244876.1 uncharacterized protein LOC110395090 [Numida meleagris]
MAEETGAVTRSEEETPKNCEEDPFPSRDSDTAFPDCYAGLSEGNGSSVVPERLSVLSSKAVAQAKALAGPEVISGSQAQSKASALTKHQLMAVSASAGGSSCSTTVCKPKRESLFCSCDQDLGASCVPGVPEGTGEPSRAVVALLVNNLRCCHVPAASARPVESCTEGSPSSLGSAIWMKTTTVMETLENKKKEEKEKYRLQLAMYRRLLLLRSIRSLHKQLEQQQARLQECYGMVINTKKEVLKHIRSTLPSPSP